jgi:glycosyltransferase involved in cell wall biosynthesis
VLHSAYARDRYAGLGVDPDRLEVVHNGFDPARFESPLSREAAKRAVGLPADRPIALYAGRVTMGKGLGAVLAMAERMPEVTFAIVGSQGEGEVETRAASLANVTFGPWASADELPAWLWAADVLLLPPSLVGLDQRGDTVLPMKLFLYLAASRPLLAPRAPDTAEILRDGDNAVLVEPERVAEAVNALQRLIADPVRAEKLAAAAARTAQQFTCRARAERVLTFLERRLAVAAPRRRARGA